MRLGHCWGMGGRKGRLPQVRMFQAVRKVGRGVMEDPPLALYQHSCCRVFGVSVLIQGKVGEAQAKGFWDPRPLPPIPGQKRCPG